MDYFSSLKGGIALPSTPDELSNKFSFLMSLSNRKLHKLLALLVLAFCAVTITRSALCLQFASVPPIIHKSAPPPPEPPKWLAATISPFDGVVRRHIIRSTWQTLYRNESRATFRFVISNPEVLWEPVIAKENETYGDIIILRNLVEDAKTANTIKTVEFFRYLLDQDQRWSFVSKIDDDSYVDAARFYDRYLEPRFHNTKEWLAPGVPKVRNTVIGKPLDIGRKAFQYPSGQFYTVSWDLMKTIVDVQKRASITGEHEDVLIGELLDQSGLAFEFFAMSRAEAFEIEWSKSIRVADQDSAWANDSADLNNTNSHSVGKGAINPHRMKKDKDYLMVAACFGPDGPKKPDYRRNQRWITVTSEDGTS
jgi:hypothetical protein